MKWQEFVVVSTVFSWRENTGFTETSPGLLGWLLYGILKSWNDKNCQPRPVAQSDARPTCIHGFDPPVRGDWSWNNFYGHSLPTADSSRTLDSFWRKYVHWVLVNRLGLSLARKGVDKLTDRLDMTRVVDWDVKQHSNKKRMCLLS